jgi:hypothetical protein
MRSIADYPIINDKDFQIMRFESNPSKYKFEKSSLEEDD